VRWTRRAAGQDPAETEACAPLAQAIAGSKNDGANIAGLNSASWHHLKTNPTTVVRVDLPQLRKSLRALETLSVEAVLDGEIVALNGDGSHPQRSMQDNRAGALLLYKRCPA